MFCWSLKAWVPVACSLRSGRLNTSITGRQIFPRPSVLTHAVSYPLKINFILFFVIWFVMPIHFKLQSVWPCAQLFTAYKKFNVSATLDLSSRSHSLLSAKTVGTVSTIYSISKRQSHHQSSAQTWYCSWSLEHAEPKACTQINHQIHRWGLMHRGTRLADL